MSSEGINVPAGSDESELYSSLLHLEELESLLEDLEEHSAQADSDKLPVDLRERLDRLGMSSRGDLRLQIAQLHSKLDRDA